MSSINVNDELNKLKTEKEVKTYFDRVLNGELKY